MSLRGRREVKAAMEVPVIIFDYFGVLAHQYGRPDQEVMDFVRQHLAGRYRLAVLSNMNDGAAEEMLGKSAEIFDSVVISGELGVAKPDPRAFLLTAQRLGEFPSRCLMIDDSELNCIGAKDAGMAAIYFTGVADLERKLKEYGILTP
ncbi:hypothetical protein B7Y94_05740 [Candidatus Saccharibacteria bacterium 32-49-12]|nr:MAG: hypothetical protein B7Y94_05740 [Candidatus Saccharibacteria bacterium 32-49-12]